MKTKKVKQTITIDVAHLEDTLKWHLGLNQAVKKLKQLDDLTKMNYDEIKDCIADLRLELSSLDMTLLEFQEIYEALTHKEEDSYEPTTPVSDEPEPVLPTPDEPEPDLQQQIDNRLIENLQYALDNED